MKPFNIAFATVLAASSFAAPYAAHAQQMSGVNRTDLSRNNLDISGYEEIQSRVDMAAHDLFAAT